MIAMQQQLAQVFNRIRALRRKKLAVALMVVLGCSPGAPIGATEEHVQAAPVPVDLAAVVQGNTAFALDLYAYLRHSEGNVFFSPLSLSTALAMTYVGARGQTAEQMAAVLHFPPDRQQLHHAFAAMRKGLMEHHTDPTSQLYLANALWGQKGSQFLEAFLQTTKTYYGAGVHTVDFHTAAAQARQTINSWVKEQTKDHIPAVIPEGALAASTRLVVTNAIYFKGAWVQPFMQPLTKDAPFHLATHQQRTVPLMSQTAFFPYLDGGNFHALELRYVGDTLAMVVFLPKQIDGLPAFEQSLSRATLTEWLSQLQAREVVVSLPKFTMTGELALGAVLAELGMPVALSKGADFSGMSDDEKLSMVEVFHKAFVDVNEAGTEAAAATGVGMRAIARRRPVVFRADHPFFFLIRDLRSESIVFLGRLVQP